MNNSSSFMNNSEDKKLENLLSWRRSTTLEYFSKGWTQEKISAALQVSQSTTQRDLAWLARQSKEKLKFHVEERMPLEIERCYTGLNLVLELAFSIACNENAKRSERIAALEVIIKTYDKISEVLTNQPILDRIVDRFKLKREQLEAAAKEIQEKERMMENDGE